MKHSLIVLIVVVFGACQKTCKYPEYHYQEWKNGVVVESEFVIFNSVLDSAGVANYHFFHYSPKSDSARLDFVGFKEVECL